MVVTKKYFVYPLNRGGGEEPDPGRGHAGYEEYQPFLAEEDGHLLTTPQLSGSNF